VPPAAQRDEDREHGGGDAECRGEAQSVGEAEAEHHREPGPTGPVQADVTAVERVEGRVVGPQRPERPGRDDRDRQGDDRLDDRRGRPHEPEGGEPAEQVLGAEPEELVTPDVTFGARSTTSCYGLICTRYSNDWGVVVMVMLKATTTAKRRTRKVGVAVAVVVAGMFFAATPAAASAYPTSTFQLPYTASYYNGTVTWYNRTVDVKGTFKASNCRRIYAEAWAGTTLLDTQNSSTWCNKTAPAPLPLEADVAGGANVVYILMTTEDPGHLLNNVTCYRGQSECS
jgi:hypothetical protein